MISDTEPSEGAGGAPAPRTAKRRSRSSGGAREAAAHSKGRESPLGAEREREFPATKVGGAERQGAMEAQYGAAGGHGAHGHAPHGRCSGGHGPPGAGAAGRAVIAGDLVQSRDFHYTVEPAPVYRRPREVAYHSQAQVGFKLGHDYQFHTLYTTWLALCCCCWCIY